jgi:hypothetical protein
VLQHRCRKQMQCLSVQVVLPQCAYGDSCGSCRCCCDTTCADVGKTRRLRSAIVQNNHHPVWNQRAVVYVADEADDITMEIKVGVQAMRQGPATAGVAVVSCDAITATLQRATNWQAADTVGVTTPPVTAVGGAGLLAPLRCALRGANTASSKAAQPHHQQQHHPHDLRPVCCTSPGTCEQVAVAATALCNRQLQTTGTCQGDQS